MTDDLLWQHLKSLPAFRALLRAVEARFYRCLALPGPILDLGCGDGHFGAVTLAGRPNGRLTAGIDPWWGPLQKATATGAYTVLAQATGDRLPFADGAFASVISNSVLEHIPDVQPVLNEVSRVLQPNGRLVVTMPNHLFTANLAGARFLEQLGSAGLADRYRRFFNAISRHAHTDPVESWARRLADAGLAVERWQYYFSPAALRALEWGHIQGLPSAALHALTGHWIVAPWESNLRGTEAWVRPFYEEIPPADGAYQLIVARKRSDGPIAVVLPPTRPFTPAELAVVDQPILPQPHEQPAVPAPAQPLDSPLEPALEEPASPLMAADDAPPATLAAPPAALARGLIPGSLLLLTVMCAMLGQSILSRQPEAPGAGLFWYGASLLSLLGLLWRQRRRRTTSRPVAGYVAALRAAVRGMPRRRWLLGVALVTASLARAQVANQASQRPALALLFWLAAIAIAAVALWPGPGDASSAVDEIAAAEPPTAGRAWPVRPLLVAAGLFLLALVLRVLDITSHPFILNGSEASIGLEAWAVANGRFQNPFATGWLTNPSLGFFVLAPYVSLLGRTVLAVRLPSAIAGALTVAAVYLLGRRTYGRHAGLTAAILLAGSHFHLHYSRLGMTNVWDPLLVWLAVGLIVRAWERPSRVSWLAAGLAIGLNAYWFTSSHLLPLILVGLFGWALLFDRRRLGANGRHILAAALLAFVVALPLLLFYRAGDNQRIFMERANQLGVVYNNQLSPASDQGEFWRQQFRQAALAFNATLDRDTSYNPGIPLLRFWPGLLFVLGAGLALFRLRRLRYAALLVWVGVTVIFGGALLENPPVSHRLVVATPALALLAGLALSWLARQAVELWPAAPRRALTILLIILAGLIAVGDAVFYFGRYRQEARFGDRNTEIAYQMAVYLQELEGDWTAYFYGPPSMYVDFPTIPFLATRYQANQNLFNVLDPGAAGGEGLPAPPAGDFVLIFLPERSGELNAWQERLPGGQVHVRSGRWADPLFFAYEVRAGAGQP